MGIKLYKEPELKNPIMFCGWPGIGNIGISAIDNLRAVLKAQEFGEIELWDFFDPRKVSIERGLLKDLEFPSSKFYFQRIRNQDLIFFIGEEQPSEGWLVVRLCSQLPQHTGEELLLSRKIYRESNRQNPLRP